MIRFCTLDYCLLTSLVESETKNIEDVIKETLIVKKSERTSRVIDYD